jgi:hypothetical protein
MGNRNEILSIERAGSEERHGHRRLESRLARTGRVGHQRDERSIDVFGWNADDDGRPHFRGHPEVHEPDLATPR